MVGWLDGWLVGWLVGWMVEWLNNFTQQKSYLDKCKNAKFSLMLNLIINLKTSF